ncbi:MAG: hypothetical protein IPP19_10355 [Verrucomicrobia bacterium]|nr:hypothetical protein [Verrucomicrobiota bacterium]
MLHSEKFQVAALGQPAKTMTLSEINLALASGELTPDDQYWIKGLPRWKKVRDLSGVILPGGTREQMPPEPRQPGRSATPFLPEPVSFWAQPERRASVSMWPYAVYFGLSLPFTPLLGSVLVARNLHSQGEDSWRLVSWFWIFVWALVLTGSCYLYFAGYPWFTLKYLGLGYGVLFVFWYFTCGLPHRLHLHAHSADICWKKGWGRPAGLGFLGWMVVVTLYLLSR